jgi:transposase
MLVFPRAVRVYVAMTPVSLRKSFDGLCNEVRCVLGADPLSGHVFIFLNRRRTQVKLLVWTRGGFTIVHKRLEKGQFSFTRQLSAQTQSVQIDVHELSMLLEGLEQTKTRSAARWEPAQNGQNGPQMAVSTH